MRPVVLSTRLPGLTRIATGKVRDVYAVGEEALLLVATDRLSAFDVVMNQGIPDKGRVLTGLSVFWFGQTASVIENHLLAADDAEIADVLSRAGAALDADCREVLAGRSMLCRRTAPLRVEAVVRGYLAGAGWKEYQRTGGDLWGHALPAGLREAERLPAPLFTPSTKAEAGHDEPLRPDEARALLGDWHAPVAEAATALYTFAAERAAAAGIVLADTKFEFGLDPTGKLLLIDEALTPDSSRFWPADAYAPGRPQPSFDKQFVRDYLESVPGWNKQPPPPDLPDEIIARTAEKYRDAYARLTGQALEE